MDDPKQKNIPDNQVPENGNPEKKDADPNPEAWDEEVLPTSLNDELAEKIRDNPNRFIGCGG